MARKQKNQENTLGNQANSLTGVWARETANGYELRYANNDTERLWEHVEDADHHETWRLIAIRKTYRPAVHDMRASGERELDAIFKGRAVPDDEHGWFMVPEAEWEQVGVDSFDGVSIPNAMQQERVRQMHAAEKSGDAFAGWRSDGAGGYTTAPEPEPVAEPEPVTEEFPEVPPHVNESANVVATSSKVREIVIPGMVPLSKVAECAGFKSRKWFRDGTGRKVGYVVWSAGVAPLIAWRDWYEHDAADVDAEVRAFAARLVKAA